MSNQLQITGGAKVRALEGVITGTTGVLSSVPYGGANGVATLDSAGKIPVSQLPNSVMEYKGTWNVTTNTPYLVNGVGNAGDVYMVIGAAVGGTNHDFGSGNILFYNGDQAIYDGSAWQRASGSSGTVTSVALTASSAFSVSGSPITTSGTLAITGAGTTSQYINGAGSLTTFPSLTGFVPYTGATNDLNLGTHNLFANNLFDGFTNVAASGSQIVLTIASTPSYTITGSGGQTIKLPDATTLPNGAIFSFNNNQSSGAININNNSNTLVVSVPSGGFAEVVLLDNSIAAGSWDRHFKAPSNVSWSTNTLDYAGSITSATWNGNVVAINRGGTGSSTQNFVDLTTTQTIGGAKTFSSSLTASSLIKTGGTSNQFLKADGSVDSTTYVQSVSGTAPVVSSGGNTPYISMHVADTYNDGYLSSANWNTFNNKANASGNSGQVAFFNGSNSVTSSAQFWYNNTYSRLGIGDFSSITPVAALSTISTVGAWYNRTSASASYNGIGLSFDSGGYGHLFQTDKVGTGSVAANVSFLNNNTALSLDENYNVGINTYAPVAGTTGPGGVGLDIFGGSSTAALALHNTASGLTISDGARLYLTTGGSLVLRNLETGGLTLNGGNGDISILSGGFEKIKAVYGGNVGIMAPATTPEALTVNGSIQQSGVTSTMIKVDVNGKFVAAAGGTDYEYPLTFTSPLVRTTNTISIPAASTSISGYLTSTDWNTFNSKGNGTVTSVTGTAPVVSSGGATPAISMAAATASVSGYLTSTDWNTFNGKFTLPSLTSGSILFSNGSTIAQNNTKLYWDNTNMRLGIGTQSVSQYVTYIQANTATNANAWLGIDNPNTTGSTAVRLILNGSTTSGFQYVQSTNMTQVYANAGPIQLINGSSLGLTIANTTGIGTFDSSISAVGVSVIKSSGIATISFPVASGGNDPAFIQHDESVSDTGIMRFSVSDNDLTNDYFVFGNTNSGTYIERFKLLATGVVTLGTWQGTAIADSYISSASTWNAKVSSVSATSPVVSSGGATPTISMPAASASVNGYLTSANWTTFNNKGTFTLPSLTSGSVLFSDGTTIVQDNTNFFFDNTYKALKITSSSNGLETGNPYPLHVKGVNSIIMAENTNTTGTAAIRIKLNSFIQSTYQYSSTIGATTISSNYSDLRLLSGSGNGIWIANSTGNVSINNFTDSGYKLDVTGTGRFSGATSSFPLDIYGTTNNYGLRINNVQAATLFLYSSNANAASRNWGLYTNSAVYGDFDIRQSNAINGDMTSGANGTSRLYIKNDGNVGIGSVTPESLLSVQKSTSGGRGGEISIVNSSAPVVGNEAALNFGVESSTYGADNGNFQIKAYLNNTNGATDAIFSNWSGSAFLERMRITSGGYTKISSDGTYYGSTGNYHEMVQSASGPNTAIFRNKSASPYGIYFDFNAASPNNTSNYYIAAGDSSANRFFVYSNGAVYGNGTYGTVSSDRRLKENIAEATSKINDLMKLRVVNFNLIGTDEKHIGFIAQEMKEVFPSFVYEKDTRKYDDEGNLISGYEDSLGIKTGMEFAILVKAIQEQQATITSLQDRIYKLENK